jgi:hypothetical protein
VSDWPVEAANLVIASAAVLPRLSNLQNELWERLTKSAGSLEDSTTSKGVSMPLVNMDCNYAIRRHGLYHSNVPALADWKLFAPFVAQRMS